MEKPTVVCLCGPASNAREFHDANVSETLAGRIVLSIGVDMNGVDAPLFAAMSEAEKDVIKKKLDALHKQKIDLADEVLIITDASRRVGASTQSEIDYAETQHKPIKWLVPVPDKEKS